VVLIRGNRSVSSFQRVYYASWTPNKRRYDEVRLFNEVVGRLRSLSNSRNESTVGLISGGWARRGRMSGSRPTTMQRKIGYRPVTSRSWAHADALIQMRCCRTVDFASLPLKHLRCRSQQDSALHREWFRFVLPSVKTALSLCCVAKICHV